MKKYALALISMLMFFMIGRATTCYPDTTKEKQKARKAVVLNNNPADVSKDCSQVDAVINIIDEAIEVGAPTYNQGNHIACYKTYEGAAYKILYKYGNKCKQVKNILETALEKSYGNYTASEKAWIMRMAFDSILGVPTTTR